MLLTPTMFVLWIAGCAGSTNLIEDLSAEEEILPGSTFLSEVPADFARTGIAISPDVERVLAPARLVIANRSGGDVVCEVRESDLCAPLPDLDLLEDLADGETWTLSNVACAELDVACLDVDRASLTDLPLRTWSWLVKPEEVL